MKIPTIFFGASSYVLPIIEFLNKNYQLRLVVTTEQKATDPVVTYCNQNNIPFVSVSKIDETLRSKLLALNTPFAILADFRLLVLKTVIDIFPKGIINIHPSLLPEYRGSTPGVTAILDGKITTGVSLMLLDTQLDHGPILGQEVEHILPTDTAVSLYERLFGKGAKLLKDLLPGYMDGKIKPVEQDHAKATYTDFLTRNSGYIDINNPLEIERKIRAYFPWPGVWTKGMLTGKEKIIKLLPNPVIARSETTKQSLADSILFQVEGKKPMSYKDFINGYAEGKEILQKLRLV